jgi:hypothetical protein
MGISMQKDIYTHKLGFCISMLLNILHDLNNSKDSITRCADFWGESLISHMVGYGTIGWLPFLPLLPIINYIKIVGPNMDSLLLHNLNLAFS